MNILDDPKLIELCTRMNGRYNDELPLTLTPKVLVNTVNGIIEKAQYYVKHSDASYPDNKYYTDVTGISVGDYSGRGTNGLFNIAIGDGALNKPVEGSFWLDYFGNCFNYEELLTIPGAEPTLEYLLKEHPTN